MTGMLRLLWALFAPVLAAAQTQYFEVLSFRGPTQCERAACLSVRQEFCRIHAHGFYLREKGCSNRQICTNCAYGNSSTPTKCRCENPPYSFEVSYGQECGQGKVCRKGEGQCYRPCYTFLHSTLCPSTHCLWQRNSSTCVKKPPPVKPLVWLNLQLGMSEEQIGTAFEQGEQIVEETSAEALPMAFDDFKKSAAGYRIRGVLLDNITRLESMFLQLDESNDGVLNTTEYGKLPEVLMMLDAAVDAMGIKKPESNQLAAAANSQNVRRLQDGPFNVTVTPEICNSLRPRQFFCSFDMSCKLDCRECGWKSATDTAFSSCVVPTPDACYADGQKVYCPSDETCHDPGNCTACVDRPIVDYSQHMCIALWWDPEPLPQWTNWVCRYRHKVGMPCRHDQDCIYGLRRCLSGSCQPFQPYNPNQTCESDLDCPHLGYYCPSDPTASEQSPQGENPYWVQYCRRQREEGMSCTEHRECAPDLRCNTGEPAPRCRRLFSLAIGAPSALDELCTYGWRDKDMKCAPPAKSKQAGRSCDYDSDCTTTDQTGRSGNCICKTWWDRDDSKYCAPVAGDYSRHQEELRNYLWFKATNCGAFWTEEECLTVFGDQALSLKLELECETQDLSGGPYLPPKDCRIDDEDRFMDPCEKLASVAG